MPRSRDLRAWPSRPISPKPTFRTRAGLFPRTTLLRVTAVLVFPGRGWLLAEGGRQPEAWDWG